MARGTVAPLCWALLFVVSAEAESYTEVCKTFSSLKISRGQNVAYWCPAEECSNGKVIGTDIYHEGSDICLAALHAGVITNLGTTITITRQEDFTDNLFGTAKNRIVSEDKRLSDESFKVYKVESTEKVEGAVGELLMVHNGGSDGLHFTCLSQDKMTPISSSSLKTWDYKDFKFKYSYFLSEDNSPQMKFRLYMYDNKHAVRIQGSRRDEDILAVVQYPNAEYQSRVATVRVSDGDSVPFHLLKSEGMPDLVHIKHLPGSWTSKPINNITSHLTPARPKYTGVYVVHGLTTKRGDEHGAYFDMIVRECKNGQFGIRCSERCPLCQNGGQCHTRRGSCLCPPGFIGDTCQFACPSGWFGNKCQFRCDQETISFKKEEKDGRCEGLTFCLPSPYGCSCAAGFTHPYGLGSTCTQECPNGYFGADCSQLCIGCIEDKCDSFSGTCTQGCKIGTDCRKGPPSPNATFTLQQRSYTASWEGSDVSALYFLSHQLVRQLSCEHDNTKRLQIHYETLDLPSYNASRLLPHASYNVCIVASSSKGLGSPECSLVKTRSAVPDVNITKLQCAERYLLACVVDISGSCENYNGPSVEIHFILKAEVPCTHSHTTLQKSQKIGKSSRIWIRFPNYLAGVQYQVRAEVVNDAGTGHMFDITFDTKEKAPSPVQNLTHIILSDSVVQLRWNDSCPSNGKITEIYIYDPYKRRIPLESCATTESFDRCLNITGLKLGEEYEYKITEANGAGEGPASSHKVVFERRPGSPQAIRFIPGLRHINLSMELPTYHGGNLKNCTVNISSSKKQCIFTLKEENPFLNCIVRKLKELI